MTFDVPVTRFAFSDRCMRRIVEAGEVEVWAGSDAATEATERVSIELPGREVTSSDRRIVGVQVE